MTYLLETSIAVALLRGHRGLRSRIRRLVASGAVAVSACTTAELCYGARRRRDVEAELQEVMDFLAPYQKLAFDDDAALIYGLLQAQLHQSGLTLPVMDVQIAAIALAHDLTLLSADAHFLSIPELKVRNWLTD
jgi:tRNA(fMet)-specific endonuclease VapC